MLPDALLRIISVMAPPLHKVVGVGACLSSPLPLSPSGIFGSDENAMRANIALTSARGKRNANASSIPGGIFG